MRQHTQPVMPTPLPPDSQPLRDSGVSARKDGPVSPTVLLTTPQEKSLDSSINDQGVKLRTAEEQRALDARLEQVTEQMILEHYQAQHDDEVTRWMINMTRGISGRLKILWYDVKVLVQWGGFMTSLLDGTILTFDGNNASFLACLVFCFTVVFLVVQGSVAQDDVDTIETESIEMLASVMNQVVPFVLSLYLSVGLTRWWYMRYFGLGRLFCSIVNVCMMVACVLPGERHQPVRTLVTKWCMASVYLLVKATRNQSRVIDMQLKGLLSEADAKAMEDLDSYSRPMVCWGWVVRVCQESLQEANGPMPYSVQYARICELCGEARDSIDNISMFLQTQLPFVYVHLITLLVDVNNVLFILKCGVISAVAFMSEDYQRLSAEILTCTCVPILYRGLLSISYVIHDPFGEEILDFPVGGYAAYVADCVSDVIKAQERFPGVPEEVYKSTRASIVRRSPLEEQPPEEEGDGPKSLEQIVAELEAVQLDPAAQFADPIKEHCTSATPVSPTPQLEQFMEEDSEPPVEETHPLPTISNAKDAAAAAAAGRVAEAIGSELKGFAERFAAEMAALNVGVGAVRDAIAKESARHNDDVFRLCSLVFQGTGEGDEHAADLAPSRYDVRRPSQIARELAKGGEINEIADPRRGLELRQSGIVQDLDLESIEDKRTRQSTTFGHERSSPRSRSSQGWAQKFDEVHGFRPSDMGMDMDMAEMARSNQLAIQAAEIQAQLTAELAKQEEELQMGHMGSVAFFPMERAQSVATKVRTSLQEAPGGGSVRSSRLAQDLASLFEEVEDEQEENQALA